MSLADKIRKSREKEIEVGGFKFTVRRPTDYQLAQMYDARKSSGEGLSLEQLASCVIGWSLPESELHAGGGGSVPEFELDAFLEWLGDRPKLYNDVASAVIKVISEHHKKQEKTTKN